ncbi:helix-turn-helix transcriptional regulator [Arthrobacter sp. HY1533]|uniref:helix-turn-helix transcriptional regulator n=1 Tax=Arthrobacter sp. HY1533 TaxID=2970919 RepID=UPI0022B9EEB1|nr:WYL domain-containing protein [Arthrobacter sp. HY1533]
MPTKIDSTERLLNLVIALLGTRRGHSKSYIRSNINGYMGEGATAAEEDKAAQSFNRMFERDKETLQELGIPISILANPAGSEEDQALYRIKPADYRVPAVRLDESAMSLVAVAANLWAEAALGEAAQSALRKIATRSGTGWYEDDTTSQSRIRTAEPAFEPLWNALRNHHTASFGYRGSQSPEDTRRTVQPWGLGNKYGQWYLAGLDVDKGQERIFRLSRITSDVEVNARVKFVRPADFHISSVLDRLGTGEPLTADIAVPAGSAHELRARTGTVQLSGEDREASNWPRGVQCPEGWDVLRVAYREAELMADDAASLGAQAQILAPAALRAAVAARLRSAADAAAAAPSPGGGAAWDKPLPARPARRKDTRERLVRLLSMVPYLVANPGVEEAEVLAEFGITAAEWARDRDTLNVTGLPGYFHGDLMDVTTEAGQVFIRDAETLASPLRLSREEACTVLVGLAALAGVAGSGQSEPLAHATAQLSAVAGGDAWLSDAVGLHLVSGPEMKTITALQEAIQNGRACHISYLVLSRDEVGERTVEPRRLFSVDAAWYLRAWCRRAGGLRSFRVDRIQSLSDAGAQDQLPAAGSAWAPAAGVYNPGSDDTAVRVLADPTTAQRLAPAYNAQLFAPSGGASGAGQRAGLQFLVGDTATLAPLMARLGGRACIAGPEEVRTAAVAWLEAAADSYGAAHAVGETAGHVPSNGR